MLINYLPGEECRVAIVDGDKLEEFHAERANAISRVGNIYVGKVTNVESAIQAAFIDFGVEDNGFLHVSDVHPQYFPGEDAETRERIGRKTPRRERPPIQQCFKKGQEVIVQVLKEGIGTKGPTLTSYLSIPGRYLVMLPDMDKVGVSRKVDDDETRRAAKKILDGLDLPPEFGFILRTAGFERTKAELKRDLAYLKRLWSDMEKRRQKGRGPRLLYAESDLLMRTLRDQWTTDVNEIVIDNVSALRRASRFMKIVAPRSGTKLLRYDAHTPLFHAFGLEEQIQHMHEREVPLPSGGSLVIDETEAMIAIDVNSGRLRKHGDAETTAFETNKEAVEEICRQLKLRDIGGLVVCDLIDMMKRGNRRAIEKLFDERLKRDRAASKALPISQFGMVEMTRQRQRGSLKSQHFAKCPTCEGRGLLKKPASVAGDALRDLGAFLDHERIASIELVVAPRVAGELLSAGRVHLTRLEHRTGKSIRVRVSDDLRADRVVFYAYDASGSDIAIDRLPKPRLPKDLPEWDEPTPADWAVDAIDEETDTIEEEAIAERQDVLEEMPGMPLDPSAEESGSTEEEGQKKKRRRRRGGRGRRRREGDEAQDDGGREAGQASEAREEPKPKPEPVPAADEAAEPPARQHDAESDEGGERKRRRRRGGRRRRRRDDEPEQEGPPIRAESDADDEEYTRPDESTTYTPGGGDSWDLTPAEVAQKYGLPVPRGYEAAPEHDGAPRATDAHMDTTDAPLEADAPAPDASSNGAAPKKKRRRRGGRGRNKPEADSEPVDEKASASGGPESGDGAAPKKKRRSRKPAGGDGEPREPGARTKPEPRGGSKRPSETKRETPPEIKPVVKKKTLFKGHRRKTRV